jgi:Mrp family chromosome partitioning ATPase
MSKNFAVLGKIAAQSTFPVPPEPGQPTTNPVEYAELIRRLFHSPTAVAVVGADPAETVSEICLSIAAQLAASNRRVLVVSVEMILRANPISVPDIAGFTPAAPNVWTWQSSAGPKLEIFKSEVSTEAIWLSALRPKFDFILLDCSSVQVEAEVAQVAAVADATVLVVHESYTEKLRIRSVQRALQFSGATLAGSILVRQR